MEAITYKKLLSIGEEKLAAAGIQEAKVDAFILFEYVTEFNRTALFMKGSEACEEEKCEKYLSYIERRCKHEPLQYITGYAPFMGYEFKVNENVLIPRMDTEVLVEEAVELIKNTEEFECYKADGKTVASTVAEVCKGRIGKGSLNILDMCTGSGCIIISLFKELTKSGYNINAATSDLSEKALMVAKENAEVLNAEIKFFQGDLFENVEGNYDIIVSNPPYIKTKVIEELDVEVKSCEPMMALDGHEDGLYFYRAIIKQAKLYFKDKGYIIFEIGHDQGSDLYELLTEAGYADIKVIKDLAGLDRVVMAKFGE